MAEFSPEFITALGTGGGFAALAWYLITRVIPQIVDRFIAAMDQMRREAREDRELDSTRCDKRMDQMRADLEARIAELKSSR